eukprot:Rhum_TRINITY_DN9630_c0_g1::Rhum_TRINITY_DN9630_c0_g1_i1::g.34421::m.34421
MAWQPGASVRTPRAYAAHRRYGSPVGEPPTTHDLDTNHNSVGGGGVGGFGSGDDDLFTMPDVPQLRSISPVRGLRTRSPPSHLPSSFSQRTEPHLRHQASRSVPWQPTPSQPPSSPQKPAPAPAEDDADAAPAAAFDTAEEDVEEWEAKVKAAMGRLHAQRRSGLLVAAAPPRMSTDEALSNAHPSVPVFALAAPDPAALSLPAQSSTRASEIATPAKAAVSPPAAPSTAGRTDGGGGGAAAAAETPVDRSSVPSMVSMAQRLPGPPPASRASSRTSGSVSRDESGATEAAAAAAAAKDLPSTASSVCT